WFTESRVATEQRCRRNTRIRAYAGKEHTAGLGNGLFCDNQVATLLEDQEKVGVQGVVMMIRLPDFNRLRDSLGGNQAEEQMFMLSNLLSTFIRSYPGSLLARYPRSDFAVLLPHRTLNKSDTVAGQLLN
ncbi:diguanylate cyclase domain-containing protein, partial [Salmonella enterica]|uniref:diguanylate cyclase domain-containing protein n=1 Tax=Salmonella enterica TaxID=28901 RepID=UPI00398C65F7